MSRTWVWSDPHLGHHNICKFEKNGVKLRPWDDVDQMDNDLINWYNELVHPDDRVYILGDVTFTAANMQKYIPRLKGRKVLVPGNHEPPKMRKYFDLFDDVRGYVVKKGFIMSHIPIHPGSMGRWQLNIHGHTHANRVQEDVQKDTDDYGMIDIGGDDPRYFCACVEQTNFRPILLDDILKQRGLV